jgi:hypothetical protein
MLGSGASFLVFFECVQVGGEPFPNLAYAKFSLGDGFGDEFVSSDSLQLEVMTINSEKCVGRGKTDSLVAIEESMIVRKRLHERRRFMDEIVVVTILWAENGCFEKTPVAKSVDATKLIDELALHLDGFGHGQVDKARREVLFRGHRDYFARS